MASPADAGSTRRDAGRAVLLLGNYLPSLTAARSLAAQGYRVIAGDGGEFSTVSHSRACSELWKHPPVREQDALMAEVLGFLDRRPDVIAVLPLQERYVSLLSRRRDELPGGVTLVLPQRHVIDTCLDKEQSSQLARECGVPFRQLRVARTLESLHSVASAVGYPCVIRPRESGEVFGNGRRALVCRDRQELDEMIPAWPAQFDALLVQAYASGPRINVHFAARDGALLASVQTKVLWTDRRDGTGLGVDNVSVRSDERLTDYTSAIVKRLGYTGVGLAQFLLPEGAAPHFLELNPRHGLGLALPKACGLDLVEASFELAGLSAQWEPEPHYAAGRRYVWTSRDVYGLRRARRSGEIDQRETAAWSRRLLRAAVGADVHATWAWRDPLPTIAVWAQLLPLGRLKRKPLTEAR